MSERPVSDIEKARPPWRLLLKERVEQFFKEGEWTNNENNLFRLRINVRIGCVRTLACRYFQNSSIKHCLCVGCEPTSAMPVLGSEGKPNIEVFWHRFWNAKRASPYAFVSTCSGGETFVAFS